MSADSEEAAKNLRQRQQLERLHFQRVAAENSNQPPSSFEVKPAGASPTDDEIMSLLRAFYGKPDEVIIEWLASMRAVRREVMLSLGDA